MQKWKIKSEERSKKQETWHLQIQPQHNLPRKKCAFTCSQLIKNDNRKISQCQPVPNQVIGSGQTHGD
jgi:hypothetical protein